MKILVIGGTKFLGKYIVSNLRKHNHQVVLMNRGNREIPEGIESIKCDKDDRNGFKNALESQEWDAVKVYFRYKLTYQTGIIRFYCYFP